jgi:hypothetical protein
LPPAEYTPTSPTLPFQLDGVLGDYSGFRVKDGTAEAGGRLDGLEVRGGSTTLIQVKEGRTG